MVLDRVPRRWFARVADYAYGARPWLKHCSIVEGALLSVRLRSPPQLPEGFSGVDHDAGLWSARKLEGPMLRRCDFMARVKT